MRATQHFFSLYSTHLSTSAAAEYTEDLQRPWFLSRRMATTAVSKSQRTLADLMSLLGRHDEADVYNIPKGLL
jgi:hypothetical protein